MLKQIIAQKKQFWLLVCMCAGLTHQMLAVATDTASETDAQVIESMGQDSIIRTLDGGISMEQRLQLRRDLHEYSRAVDPGLIQIEERRRLMRKRILERFMGSDKDNNGSISREEATETLPQIARHFNQVDLNNDGVITLNELEAVQAKAIERQQAATVKAEENLELPLPGKAKNKQAASEPKKAL